MKKLFNRNTATALIWLAICGHTEVVLAANAPDKLPAAQAPLILGEVDGDTFDQMTVINIRFNTKVSWTEAPKIEDHGMFLQISLPDTMVTEPGKFIDGPAPHFPKIAVIQATSKDAAVRIFTVKPASLVRESSKTEILGDRLIMTLNHNTLQSLLANGPANPEPTFVGPVKPAAKTTVSADQIIAETTVRSDIPAPSLVLKKEPKSGLTGNASQIDLRGKLTKVAAFCGVMFMILIATWMAKPYMRKRRRKKSGESGEPQNLNFETLATMPLSPRQKLMVVQIGNERVLLGVCADSISFLTNLNQNPQPAFAMGAPQISPAAKVLSSIAARNFSDTLNDDGTVDMHPRPVLKNIEGNDPVSLSSQVETTPFAEEPARRPSSAARVTRKAPEAAKSAPAAKSERTERPGSRLNIRIDDNGATKVTARPAKAAARTMTKEPEEKKQAIDDITTIIREKLNTLRTI